MKTKWKGRYPRKKVQRSERKKNLGAKNVFVVSADSQATTASHLLVQMPQDITDLSEALTAGKQAIPLRFVRTQGVLV
jgi:hypothetical protein